MKITTIHWGSDHTASMKTFALSGSKADMPIVMLSHVCFDIDQNQEPVKNLSVCYIIYQFRTFIVIFVHVIFSSFNVSPKFPRFYLS